MSDLKINYAALPVRCKRDDVECQDGMYARPFLMALDYVTTDNMDGVVHAEQISDLLVNGQLKQESMRLIAEEFNERSPSGIKISGVPYARDFKEFLISKHPSVYHHVFGHSGVETKLKVTKEEAKEVILNNLNELVMKIEKIAQGDPQSIEHADYFVRTAANGFRINDHLSKVFVDEIGGEAMAEECQRLLGEAFDRYMEVKKEKPNFIKDPEFPSCEQGTPSCDQTLSDGTVDLSQCYVNTSNKLRMLAYLVDEL